MTLDKEEQKINPVEETESTETWKPSDADKDLVKMQIRNRVRNAQVSDNAVFIPAKPAPSITDTDDKVVSVYARVSTKSTEQVSSIENQTKYYTDKIDKTPNWTMNQIYSDEGKSGTSMRKRDAFKQMLKDAKDNKMDLILCASVSRFARNVSDCMEQVRILKTQNPNHPVGVYFETENIYTLDPESHQQLSMHAMLADWESANKSRRMIISYDQRICTGQYPVLDLLGLKHTKDGKFIIVEDQARTVRFAFLALLAGATFDEIADELTRLKRPTLNGRTDWNAAMVKALLCNERRWGDLDARKTVVIDFAKGTTVKNHQIRDAAYVTNHHKGIVSREIGKAAQYIMNSNIGYSGGVAEQTVIKEGSLKGFITISPKWAGIDLNAQLKICEEAYTDEEFELLKHDAKILSGEEHSNVMSMQFDGYQVPRGIAFMNRSNPALTVSPHKISLNNKAFEKMDCEYIQFLYHPILRIFAMRPCDEDAPCAFRWLTEDGKKKINISADAFCKALYEKMDWITSFRFKFRGITRERGNSKIMLFYLDEPQILLDKKAKEKYNIVDDKDLLKYIPYRNFEIEKTDSDETPTKIIDFGMSIGVRKHRDSIINNISEQDLIVDGTAVINPMIGALPSRQELEDEIAQLIEEMEAELNG